jgi:hypothetical protein
LPEPGPAIVAWVLEVLLLLLVDVGFRPIRLTLVGGLSTGLSPPILVEGRAWLGANPAAGILDWPKPEGGKLRCKILNPGPPSPPEWRLILRSGGMTMGESSTSSSGLRQSTTRVLSSMICASSGACGHSAGCRCRLRAMVDEYWAWAGIQLNEIAVAEIKAKP